MYDKNRNGIFFFIFLILIITTIFIYNKTKQFHLTTKNKFTGHFKTRDSSKLVIALIGDSWVAGNIMDELIHERFKIKQKKVDIISRGQYGAHTKDIYLNFFKKQNEIHSLNQIINSKPDYCFISAGNNDLDFGVTYYTHHMILIIQFLLENDIKPIVMRVPDYETHVPDFGVFEDIKYYLRSFFINGQYINTTESFNVSLASELKKNYLLNKVLFVDNFYDKNMKEYVDYSKLHFKTYHLNNPGKSKLADKIANSIFTDYYLKNNAIQ